MRKKKNLRSFTSQSCRRNQPHLRRLMSDQSTALDTLSRELGIDPEEWFAEAAITYLSSCYRRHYSRVAFVFFDGYRRHRQRRQQRNWSVYHWGGDHLDDGRSVWFSVYDRYSDWQQQ
jgi:hypothetical protein